MPNQFDFMESLKAGKAGENFALKLIFSVFGVEPAIAGPHLQRKGIDLIVPSINVEIKTDYHTSGNFFLEFWSEDELAGIAKTKSDVVLYIFPKLEKAYFLNSGELKEFIRKNQTKYRQHEVHSKRGSNVWSVWGIIVPIEDVLDKVTHFEYNFGESNGRKNMETD